MNIVLSGGVGREKDKIMIEYLASILPLGARILYISLAKQSRKFPIPISKVSPNILYLPPL